jgi:DNA-binding NtrC family response regulator
LAIPGILIICDDANSSAAMTRTLASLGYHVFAAEDFADGLDLFQATRYSVVLVESCHCAEEGLALVRQLRERQADIACILIAEHGEIEQWEATQRIGIRRCLSRPVNPDDLIDAVESILCGDSLKFDQQHGEDEPNDRHMVKCDRPAWCEVCGYRTHWHHQVLLRYFCSESCLQQYDRK